MTKFYNEMATWWHLISPPSDYEEEVEFFLPLLADVLMRPSPTLLELGSGGGNNAFYMKHKFASVTLTDLSPQMLAMSRQINPECEHFEGDMRTLRLNRTFDVVFIHDALDYMTSLDDLRQALETAFIHCQAGGMVLLVPDHVRETFEPATEHGGEDDADRAVRLLEWTFDPDPDDSTYITDYVMVFREGDEIVSVEHDRHTLGLFGRDEWLGLLEDIGFKAHSVIDNYERHVFVAHKP